MPGPEHTHLSRGVGGCTVRHCKKTQEVYAITHTFRHPVILVLLASAA